MSADRCALFRQRATLTAQLAQLDAAIAETYEVANDVPESRRRRRVAPAEPVDEVAAKLARQALRERGTLPR